MIDRVAFVTGLIGKPWVANAKGPDAYDCYHLVQHTQRHLFNREMLDIHVPNDPTWKYIAKAIEAHPERANWEPITLTPTTYSKAPDGSIVVLGANRYGMHLGVWFQPENGVLHTDNPDGVVFHDLLTLRALGWQRLIFFRPKE
jgi:cell wall-associated NlpC family hydrolase